MCSSSWTTTPGSLPHSSGRCGSEPCPYPVNPLYGADDYPYFVEDSGARLAIVDAVCAEKVRAPKLLLVDELEPSEELQPVDTLRDDVAFWLYSSGSTGRPKGVVHLHRDLLFTCETYARHVLGITDQDVTFSTTKLFHAYGLGNNLSFPYWAGATTVLLSGRPSPDAIFAAVERFRPTLFFSVPTLYNAMLAAERDGDFSSARLCVSAAEPLPADVWHRWRNKHDLGDPRRRRLDRDAPHLLLEHSRGHCPGLEWQACARVRREARRRRRRPSSTGRGRATSTSGGRACSASTGTRPRRQRTASAAVGSTPATGIGETSEGRYWCEGRADDMFKVSGLWVSPADVEGRLIEHPAVLEAAVVGVPVEGFTKGKACVTVRDSERAGHELAEELREFCAVKLHRYQVPELIEFVDSLPKTATGKIERYKLRPPV